MLVRDLRDRIAQRLEREPRSDGEQLALPRRRDPLASAHEERCAELVLEPFDRETDGRLADVEQLCRLG